MDKPIYHRRKLDWLAYLHDNKATEIGAAPTPKQAALLEKLFVPVWVIDRLTKKLASDLIDQGLKERHEWIEAKKHEEAMRVLAPSPKVSRPAKPEPTKDKRTGLIGSPDQTQWADRIRTSLTPYLQKMKAVAIPHSPTFVTIEHSMKVQDARFWIAFRRADVDPMIFKRMLADVEKRMMLETVTLNKVDWDDFEMPNDDDQQWSKSGEPL